MKHLDDQGILRVAREQDGSAGAAHHVSCTACGRRVLRMRNLLEQLEVVRDAGQGLPPRLLRWAKAYASAHSGQGVRWSVLDLLSEAAPLAASVRGAGGHGAAFLYGDDRHQLDLRVEPREGGAFRLHGQVIPLEAPQERQWSVVAIDPTGVVTRTRSDLAGEFRLDCGVSWVGLSLIAEHGGDRLVVDHVGTRVGA